MAIMWITLVLVFMAGCLARRYDTPVTIGEEAFSNPNKFFTGMAMGLLVAVAGLRSNIGDTGYYIYDFIHNVPNSVLQAIDRFTLFRGDAGFTVFQSFIKSFISSDPQVFLFLCALITNGLIVAALYKHSPVFEFSLFLYIASGAYLVTMNGMRQCLVAAVLFLGVKLITEGKWVPFFAIVCAVSTMHTSALIFIPAYYFVRLKPWSLLVWITLLGSVGVLTAFKTIGPWLLAGLAGTQYGHYEQDILIGDGGANLIRSLVAAVPVVLAYLGRKQLAFNTDKLIDVLINFSVLNLVFTILSVQNWIFARLSIYFDLFSFLLIPWLILKLFDPKTGALIYTAAIALYGVYYFFELESYLAFWGVGYRSEILGLDGRLIR